MFELHEEAIESGDADAFRKVIQDGIEQLRKQMAELLFRRAGDAAAAAGNVFSAEGGPITGDLLCRMLESITIDFDDRGQPIMPTLVINPAAEERVRKLLDEPEIKLRLDAIIRRKWMDRYALKLD
jgi:hypothetical protein